MKGYWTHTPTWIQRLFPSIVWHIKTDKKKVYLTFDDGPQPEITPWVLQKLEQYKAKATFFCVGDNIRKYPEIAQQVYTSRHTLANHSFSHLNGWKTNRDKYLKDIEQAQNTLKPYGNKKLFRPPYGKASLPQIKQLKKQGYQVILWDVLSADFDGNISTKECTKNVLQHVKPGSIVVFHDSNKFAKKLKEVLPVVLQTLKERGYTFKTL